MASIPYHPAPPLSDRVAGKAAFCQRFRSSGVPARLEGPDGRVICFSERNEGKYAQFFSGRRSPDSVIGHPAQRLSWVEETLCRPDEIWHQSDGAGAREFFVSRYELSDGRRVLYVIVCRASEESGSSQIEVEPRDQAVFSGPEDREWKRRIGLARLVWPASQEAGEEPPVTIWRLAVCFGSTIEWVDHNSWVRRFRQIEGDWPVQIKESFCQPLTLPVGEFEYWILDANTTARHADFDHGFNQAARAAGAAFVILEHPSALSIIERDGRLRLVSATAFRTS